MTLKKGDLLRYLGGDPSEYQNNLTVGKIYEVMRTYPDGDAIIIDNDGDEWTVAVSENNVDCFVEVFDELDGDKPETSDAVNHPPHYTRGKFETIEVIEQVTAGYDDGFVAHCAGTAIKYIARAPFKHATPTEDLRKAAKYLEFAIKRLESEASE